MAADRYRDGHRRAVSRARRGLGAGVGGANRSLGRLRALLNWAVKVGYLDETPFERKGQTVVKMSSETPRNRRLNPDVDEEAKLLAPCNSHLRGVVEAALETGARCGEILSLQWSQVEGIKVDEHKKIIWEPKARIFLPASKTKTKRDRRIPINTRLQSILEMQRFDPAGEALPMIGHVFGNSLGQKINSTKRSWMRAVLRGTRREADLHEEDDEPCPGITRAVLKAIDLRFHDLRREAGSRWLEGGVPLHTVRDWLGHTSIAQTSTYLASTMQTQRDAMTAFEARRQNALQRIATDDETGAKEASVGDKEGQTVQQKCGWPRTGHPVNLLHTAGGSGPNELARSSQLSRKSR